MVKCKKNGINVSGCAKWMGSNPIGECEICVLRGGFSEAHGKRKGVAESIRKNTQGPLKNTGNIVKRIPTRKVRGYFRGGSSHEKKN